MYRPYALVLATLCAGCIKDAPTASAPDPVSSGGWVESFQAAAVGTADSFQLPFSATPDPDGQDIFLTGVGTRGPTIFRQTAGSTPIELTSGSPLGTPTGIDISGDGQTLFIADPVADVHRGIGGLFTLPSQGGTASLVAGTAGYRPTAVTWVDNQVYFTGHDPADGAPGVFRIEPQGGSLQVIAKGRPFSNLGGVTVDRHERVYVADMAGVIYRIENGQITEVLADMQTGFPAGLALTLDESALIVSARDLTTANDQILRIELASGQVDVAQQGLEGLGEPGGLGRAKNHDIFAWSDLAAGGAGTVYRITTR